MIVHGIAKYVGNVVIGEYGTAITAINVRME